MGLATKLTRLLVLALAVLMATPWHAFASTKASNMVNGCEAVAEGVSEDTPQDVRLEAALCLGVIDGVVQTSISYQNRGVEPIFCLPSERIGSNQIARIVTQYMSENADKLHFSASLLVSAALKDAFPCTE